MKEGRGRNHRPDETAVVLAAHGIPAADFPRFRVGLFVMLEFAGRAVERLGVLRAWRDSLDRKIRTWPRTPANDTYKAAVEGLAAKLSARLGRRVVVAYNEFCDPGLGEAIDGLIDAGIRRLVVVPTMLVRGNSHTEIEIRESVLQAARRHPAADIGYAWPFEDEGVVSLLKGQVENRLGPDSRPTA